MGDDSGEIHPPSSGTELNSGNYRIRAEDRLGEGSLKQKCRDNFAAIELVNRLDIERRAATEDEKRVLVKYVGWGGIPQVFAEHPGTDWEVERAELRRVLTDSQCFYILLVSSADEIGSRYGPWMQDVEESGPQ